MPEKKTIERARRDKAEGKAPSTQAGEFIREEIHHVREGKHGARSTKQAIAIGLSKARQSGVDLPPPKRGSEDTVENAERAYGRGQRARARRGGNGSISSTRAKSPRRSRAVQKALKREGKKAGSRSALSTQAKTAAKRRRPSERSAAARKGARTKGAQRPAGRARRSTAAKKAARTRRSRASA